MPSRERKKKQQNIPKRRMSAKGGSGRGGEKGRERTNIFHSYDKNKFSTSQFHCELPPSWFIKLSVIFTEERKFYVLLHHDDAAVILSKLENWSYKWKNV